MMYRLLLCVAFLATANACADTSDKCARWKALGKCSVPSKSAQCQLTCDTCPSGPGPLPAKCDSDVRTDCQNKKNKGKCAAFKAGCAKTCDPDCQTGVASPPSSAPVCADVKPTSQCVNKKNKGACSVFRSACAKTCGYCSSNDASPPAPASTPAGCVDIRTDCAAKKKKGKCSPFINKCQLTCNPACAVVDSPPAAAPPPPPCVDTKTPEKCANIVRRGSCSSFKVGCARSCKFCTDGGITEAPTAAPVTAAPVTAAPVTAAPVTDSDVIWWIAGTTEWTDDTAFLNAPTDEYSIHLCEEDVEITVPEKTKIMRDPMKLKLCSATSLSVLGYLRI